MRSKGGVSPERKSFQFVKTEEMELPEAGKFEQKREPSRERERSRDHVMGGGGRTVPAAGEPATSGTLSNGLRISHRTVKLCIEMPLFHWRRW